MSTLKLTKNELRSQQTRLKELQRYLPTLQLKKAMLQFEVNNVQTELLMLEEEMLQRKKMAEEVSGFLLEKVNCDLFAYAEVQHVKKHYENIAGVEIPIFDSVFFRDTSYFLIDTPIWTEGAVERLRQLIIAREKIHIVQEKRRALEKELREVSIRVNLFEKILIPRTDANIRKIRIFLGDQQLSAVAQAKIAKAKKKDR